jgi:subfamily B ATP-binding cassette protein HlyB/CyaB
VVPVPRGVPGAQPERDRGVGAMSAHSAVHCLVAVARHHGLPAATDTIVEEHGLQQRAPTIPELVDIARGIGLTAKARALDAVQLIRMKGVFPLIAMRRDGAAMLVAGVESTGTAEPTVAVIEAGSAEVKRLARQAFDAIYAGRVVLLGAATTRTGAQDRPFGMRWFLPEILRERTMFRDIVLASLALSAVALGLPVFTQLVIDKVLVHQSTSTLIVLTIGVMLSILFESVFGYVRQYLLLFATRRIDMRLARQTFGKLLSLPVDYFERRTAGVVTRHVQQVQTIRGFLTGSLFFTAIECVMFFVFLPVLIWYSPILTGVVFVIAMLMALTILSLLGTFRRRLSALATAESHRQGMLVETIHGARTIKALSIEPGQRKQWEDRTAEVIELQLGVMKVSIAGQAITQFLQRTMGVAIIVIGAWLVFEREMSVGVLIAFQMLSGRVVGPLVQVVGLIHEYQQVAVAADMLGDIMNYPSESRAQTGLRPAVQGAVTIESLAFRYPGASTPALDDISMDIEAGEVTGIVGRSGSGKSTLGKLLLSLHTQQQGVIRLDGVDLREIDLSWLRRQVGVVLQDNFMFRGTIRENIATARRSASMEEIVLAARAAGADEFIERLPQGFETLLEENAANLSGGQRQRLAIARALLARPRVLIFDEATSALDPESEAIVMRNLSRIAQGRTVILISHRLSTLVPCSRIAFLENGKLLDYAPHAQLLDRCQPYRALWNQQMRVG